MEKSENHFKAMECRNDPAGDGGGGAGGFAGGCPGAGAAGIHGAVRLYGACLSNGMVKVVAEEDNPSYRTQKLCKELAQPER